MDLTLIALLVASLILIGLHVPFAAMAVVSIVALAAIATRASWAVLQAFEPAQVPERVRD